MEVTRRGFIATGSTAVAAAATAVEEKVYDGGFADVSLPGVPMRETPLVPAGAGSIAEFRSKCVGCQLCVTACPENVLRPSMSIGRVMLPEMGFERGYCRLGCSRCGEVCPASAIVPLSPERRRHVHIGRAVFHKDRCLAMQEDVNCDACARHCPVKAIYRVPRDPANPGGVKVPVVDAQACVGCGACEHLCPARPMPGFTVTGLAVHRTVSPMGEADVLAEAKRILSEDRAAVVAFRDGVITAHAGGRGIEPLLRLYDDDPSALKGATVVDKVVGRAAAGICALAGARAVHGLTVSDSAAEYLAVRKIVCTADVRVRQILDGRRKGLCPMEQEVGTLDNPAQIVAAIRRKLEKMRVKAAKR